jgi:hypothetical protein
MGRLRRVSLILRRQVYVLFIIVAKSSLLNFLVFQDAKELEVIINQAQALVPSLQEEYEQVAQELEQEKAFVAEIESSDQEYLNELKTTISEQK